MKKSVPRPLTPTPITPRRRGPARSGHHSRLIGPDTVAPTAHQMPRRSSRLHRPAPPLVDQPARGAGTDTPGPDRAAGHRVALGPGGAESPPTGSPPAPGTTRGPPVRRPP